MDNPPIFKIKHIIEGNSTIKIIVFFGIDLFISDPNTLFKQSPRDKSFANVFSQKELDDILDPENPIEVFFSNQQIHLDDSIGTIKLKLLQEIPQLSIEQIYLFARQTQQFNPTNIFQILTQNGKLELTKVRLAQFLSNIVNKDELGELEDKETYDYDDILKLNLTQGDFIVNKALGQKFFIVENEYPFICNPFDVKVYDPFIERTSRKSLTTLNSHLLLNTGPITDNTIYLCLSTDVLKSVKILESTTIQIYFPFLLQKGIHSLEELEEKKYTLIEENKQFLTKNVEDTFKSVDLFYDIHRYKKTTKKYKATTNGIKYIKIEVKPMFSMRIPLDIIFKIIHATEMTPFIKYNPSSRMENIYRLYTDKISTDGRKIPSLPKASIFKLMREIGKTKTVSIYFDNIPNVSLLYCDFDEDGVITVTCAQEQPISLNSLEELIKRLVNPVIDDVKIYLEQNGYTLSLFESIYNENTQVKKLDFVSNFDITKNIDMDDLIGCVTGIFVVETKKLKAKKEIALRFKRVSNFNKMTSQEAFVIEQANQKDGLKGDEIVLALMENYKMGEDEPRGLVAKLANEIQVERGLKRRDIEIKSNPGFKTTILLNSIKSSISVIVENINNIYYLNVLPIYVDSLIRLTQDKKATDISTKTISKLCSTDEKEEIMLQDIISHSEDAESEKEVSPVINDVELDFSSPMSDVDNEPKLKSAIDLIYGNDDDEEEEESDDSKKSTSSSRGGSSSSESFPEIFIENGGLSDFGSESKSHSVDSIASQPSLKTASYSSSSSSVFAAKPKKSKYIAEKKEKMVKSGIPEIEEKDENTVRDIVGLSLKNPPPFVKKLFEEEPTLFLREDNGKFNRYSRTCASNRKKQPVIITEEEMEEMKAEDYEKIVNKYGRAKFEALSKENQDKIIERESFLKPEDVLKYGSNPDKKYYYTCPRYWCLKTNRPIDPSEMVEVTDKNGKKVKRHPTCGGIIPDSQKTIKNDGNYVYEFFNEAEHGSRDDAKYKKHYPGFLDSDKHPDGLCIPCCFAKWNTPKQMTRRKECAQHEGEREDKDEGKGKGERETKAQKEVSEEKEEVITEKDFYIKGPEKFPLEPGRWGYLPPVIQHFFQESSSDCQISKTNTNLKPGHPCLLRHGIEFNKNQSFIACIADAKFYGEKSIPTIPQMKEIIIRSLSLDDYITCQNGNNVTSFQNEKKVDITPYLKTKLYERIKKSHPASQDKAMLYFNQAIASFENFIDYLRDDSEVIDYTYLWDIICRPNPLLFSQGINLIIMDIVNNDATNNIELICPTNHYSNEFYNPSRQTLFIIKQDDLYEPIYSYELSKKSKIGKLFSEHNQSLSANMRAIFSKVIKPILNEICAPQNSMPNVYKFKRPLNISMLIKSLNKKKYIIQKQILNYQNKVIGLFVKKDKSSQGYVPCYPSALDPTYSNFVFMDEPSLYTTYDKTIEFLTRLDKETKGYIPVKPAFKLIEDEMIVGILTDSNQLIQISEPLPITNATDDIPSLNDSNYIVNKSAEPMTTVGSYTQQNNQLDDDRVNYIKRIKLETHFYNAFKNTVRILLNNYENLKLREELEKEIKKSSAMYHSKLNTTVELLKKLVSDSIVFSDHYDISLINKVSNCIILPKNKCNANSPVCAYTKTNNRCQLIIPRENLSNPEINNETFYFSKMADELIRYSRVKAFIFEPQTYMSFENINYNLRENEIILIQSLLTKEYFENMIPDTQNKYVKYNTYDNTHPIIHQVYDNNIVLDDTYNLHADDGNIGSECEPSIEPISSKIWKTIFPSDFKELYYNKQNCGFNMLANMINKTNGSSASITSIKTDLVICYRSYPNYQEQIIDILMSEGKRTQGLRVKQQIITLQQMIFLDDYFITNLDIWMICDKYKIPCILVSSKPIILTNKADNIFTLYGKRSDSFVFVNCPAMRPEIIPKYSIIVNSNPSPPISYPLTIFSKVDHFYESIENKVNISAFLETFSKKNVLKKAQKKKTVVLVDEEEGEGEEEVEQNDNIVTFVPSQQTKKQKTFIELAKTKKRRQVKN
jgi:hypothetical protein